MHKGAPSGVKSSGATSLQGDVPTEVTYSNSDIIIALQEVLAKNLQFHNGAYSELPAPIKLILTLLLLATLFWPVIVLLCSLSLRLCLPETLVLSCCVPFLPSLAPP